MIPALDKGTGETVEDDCQDYDTDASLKTKTNFKLSDGAKYVVTQAAGADH